MAIKETLFTAVTAQPLHPISQPVHKTQTIGSQPRRAIPFALQVFFSTSWVTGSEDAKNPAHAVSTCSFAGGWDTVPRGCSQVHLKSLPMLGQGKHSFPLS